jgi:hypothetical protein
MRRTFAAVALAVVAGSAAGKDKPDKPAPTIRTPDGL